MRALPVPLFAWRFHETATSLPIRLIASFALLSVACLTHQVAGGEPSKKEDIKKVVEQLSSGDPAKSAEARDVLLAMPIRELVEVAPELLNGVRGEQSTPATTTAILSLFGPDCADAIPAYTKAIATEKDAGRRRALIHLLGCFGTSARNTLPVLNELKLRDNDAGVRDAAAATIERIDVPDSKVQEILRVLRKRQHDTAEEMTAAFESIRWVQRHWGVDVDTIQEMMRLKLFADKNRAKVPFGEDISTFFMMNAAAMRIAGPILVEFAEKDDVDLRNGAFETLTFYGGSRFPCAWPAVLTLKKLLDSEKPEVRRKTVQVLSVVRGKFAGTDSVSDAVLSVQPKLQEVATRDKDDSVRKAAQTALKAFDVPSAHR